MPIFSNKRYAFLWCGHLVSTIGDYLLYAALPFLIYDRTGSAMAGAGIFISILLPPVLFGSIAGVLADRWDRRRIMIAADALRALILLSLLVHPRYWWVAHIVAFLESLFSQLFSPARNALLPSLVKPDHLVEANSFSALAENIGRLSGPALGGVLLATTGAEGVIFADSMSYMISAVFIGMIPAVPYKTGAQFFNIPGQTMERGILFSKTGQGSAKNCGFGSYRDDRGRCFFCGSSALCERRVA